jgi:hypothetical protein
MPVRSAPEPPAYGRPMHQQSPPHNPQPQQPQQYGAPVHSYAPHQFPKVNLCPPFGAWSIPSLIQLSLFSFCFLG